MLAKKSLCTGCSACYAKCPDNCITMQTDSEGFACPDIDESRCRKCGLCKNVCPAIRQGSERTPLRVYAAKNTDEEIRRTSSSGGIFTALAEQIIDAGGVVFGARFNERWEVIHDHTETREGLAKFRCSKYVQSNIGDTYKQVQDFLAGGRKVLFSGTPCQIAGLKMFLQKEYETLLAVDFICSGVSSPLVWEKHVKNYEKKGFVTNINFRAKYNINNTGGKGYWKAFMFSITYNYKKTVYKKQLGLEHGDAFQQGYINNLFLRPSCHQCPAKSFKSGSDITLGDFWGIEKIAPEFYDDNGISIVLINTKKGRDIYSRLDKKDIEVNYNDVKTLNGMMNESADRNAGREIFFRLMSQGLDTDRLIRKFTAAPLPVRLKNLCVRIVKQAGLYDFIKTSIRFFRDRAASADKVSAVKKGKNL